jgi:hypothetical protein
MLPPSSPYYISQYGCHWQRASPSTAPALAVCELRVDGRGSSLPRGERMRLTRSGAALQWRRARALIFAIGDPIALAADRTRLVPRSGTWNVRWKTRSPGPPVASVPGAFISPVSVHEPPGRATTTTEKPRLKLPGTWRTAGRAPRPPGSRVRTYALAQPGAALPSLDSEWATRRPVARLPGWLLHRGGTSTWAACAWPLVQQQHTEQRARDFSRGASPLAF